MKKLVVSNREDCSTAELDLRCDRLSELPDSLILEILSFLETEDAVRTTILSKRWKDLWTTVPCLRFTDSYKRRVHGALAKWKGDKILKFDMSFSEDPPSTGILDSWLLVPIEKQVEVLYLFVGNQMDPYYRPTQRLYSCSSLTELYLACCDLKIEQNAQWYALKSLTIEYPFSLSEDAMTRILSGAPLLEELVLWTLDIYEVFNIRSTSLKMLEIGNSTDSSGCARTVVKAMLSIWAPNLLSLNISACIYATCLLDVPSLTSVTLCFEDSCSERQEHMFQEDFPPLEMFVKLFRSIGHAEKVTLSSLCIELLLNIKEDNMITFSNTKFLKLYPCDAKDLEMFLRCFLS